METCYIFGAADGLPEKFMKNDNDLVIAADAGFMHLKKMGTEPDIIVGDFDSLGHVPEGKEVIKHPVKKDDTDTLLAVKTAFDRGFKKFVLYGCAGKRLDHTFANLQVLSFIAERGGTGFLCGDDFTATVIKNGKICFCDQAQGNISVFSLVEKSEGLTVKGLLYELDNEDLSYDFPLGVSNEFKGVDSEIGVKNGSVMVVWSGKNDWVVNN